MRDWARVGRRRASRCGRARSRRRRPCPRWGRGGPGRVVRSRSRRRWLAPPPRRCRSPLLRSSVLWSWRMPFPVLGGRSFGRWHVPHNERPSPLPARVLGGSTFVAPRWRYLRLSPGSHREPVIRARSPSSRSSSLPMMDTSTSEDSMTGTCRPSARIAMAEKRRFRSDCRIWREGSFIGRDVRRLYTVSRPPVQRAPSSHARWDRWSGVVRCRLSGVAAVRGRRRLPCRVRRSSRANETWPCAGPIATIGLRKPHGTAAVPVDDSVRRVVRERIVSRLRARTGGPSTPAQRRIRSPNARDHTRAAASLGDAVKWRRRNAPQTRVMNVRARIARTTIEREAARNAIASQARRRGRAADDAGGRRPQHRTPGDHVRPVEESHPRHRERPGRGFT